MKHQLGLERRETVLVLSSQRCSKTSYKNLAGILGCCTPEWNDKPAQWSRLQASGVHECFHSSSTVGSHCPVFPLHRADSTWSLHPRPLLASLFHHVSLVPFRNLDGHAQSFLLRVPLPQTSLTRLLVCGPTLNAVSSSKPSLSFQAKPSDSITCSHTPVSAGSLPVSFEARFDSV